MNLARRIFAVPLSLLAMCTAGCSWSESSRSSVLVIAVERLGFGAVTCAGDDERQSGFEILCHEAVRFTHAYTPSTLSVPTLASVLTGRHPHEHLVRDNGATFLSARFDTVAESALRSGRRTAFFGGGPPVWRHSGLNQGFEVFDDGISSVDALYRPASEVVRLFLDWKDAEVGSKPSFAMLHFADPQFVDAPSVTDLGEVRPSIYRSQIEEVDETLGSLFKALRRSKAWDTTTIVVMGLAGHVTETRAGELLETNVNSERTRVSFFIKPASRGRASTLNWKVDPNVSLTDLGPTLFELLGESSRARSAGSSVDGGTRPQLTATPVPLTISLIPVLSNPDTQWMSDRIVMTESSWASWRGFAASGLSGFRFALRRGPLLYLHDGPGLLFNTLTDSLETTPVPVNDLRYQEMRAPFDTLTAELALVPWEGTPPDIADRLNWSRDLWRTGTMTPELLERMKSLMKRTAGDAHLQAQLHGWSALFALRERRWADLKEIARQAANPMWEYVAATNLEETARVPDDPCFRLFADLGLGRSPTVRECPNREALEMFYWIDESQPPARRQSAMENFFRIRADALTQQKVAVMNHSIGLTWGLPLSKPDGPRVADLILALPEMRRYRAQIDRRFSGKNQ